MITDKDRLYFQIRAETELRLAAEAEDPAVCRAHYQMATEYLDAAHGAHMRLPPRSATAGAAGVGRGGVSTVLGNRAVIPAKAGISPCDYRHLTRKIPQLSLG